jgi:hypothetical protein
VRARRMVRRMSIWHAFCLEIWGNMENLLKGKD